MFGYVRPYISELRVRDNEYYNAIYCGLCRSLGKCIGTASRFTLNYDFVFAALLRLAAVGEEIQLRRCRCAVHPIKKRPMAEGSAELDFCARAAVILSYHKVGDDISDERGSKRFRAKCLSVALRGMRRRAKKQLLLADEIVSRGLLRLAEIEAQRLPSVDIPADAFGTTMAELLSLGIEGNAGRVLYSVGFHLGRWLYIIDAADDMSEDKKRGRYNPFVLLHESRELNNSQKTDIFNALTAELMEIEAAFELLSERNGQSEIFAIIRNILHLGMPAAAEKALGAELERN